MDEDKRKHLEFIQNVITRMNTNSFLIKGWMITLVSALFALSAKDSDSHFVWVTLLAIPFFWVLDGFYLSQERRYRGLYKSACNSKTTNFEMDASETAKWFDWPKAILSTTLLIMYVPALVVALLAALILNKVCHLF